MEGKSQKEKSLFSHCHWTQGWEELELALTQELLKTQLPLLPGQYMLQCVVFPAKNK